MSFTLEEFAQIIGLPCHGQCSYIENWSLNYLRSHSETFDPYHTFIPNPQEIKEHICFPHKAHGLLQYNGDVNFIESPNFKLFPLKIFTDEIRPNLRKWMQII